MARTLIRTRDLLERSLWTGVETGLGILTADSFGWITASPAETLTVAGIATLLTSFKVFANQRLESLEA